MSNLNINKNTRTICEGAICIALSYALAFFKIPIGISVGGFGGSIDFVMVPLIIFAYRHGIIPGMAAGFSYGLLKYFLAGGAALNWVSLLLDYSIAYAMIGLGGVFSSKNYKDLPFAALTGCVFRFVIHFISGITVYAAYCPEEFLGLKMNVFVYSFLYNVTYMFPNTVIAIAACFFLIPLMKKADS